jgi:hypothetical protein
MAPPIELLLTLLFSVFNSEGLLLQRKNDQSTKIKEFGKFRPAREKFAESPKGRNYPLRAFDRASSGRTFSSFAPKDWTAAGIIV